MADQAGQPVPRHLRVHDPASLKVIGQAFKVLNRWMVLLWRLGLGRWAEVYPPIGGRMLVVEHRGRRSGIEYLTPLNFTRADGAVDCLAAFGPGADWYRNVMAMDDLIVWLPDGRWRCVASDVSDAEDRIDRIRSVLVDAGLAAPGFGMFPHTMSDEELADASGDYRIVRLNLVERIDSGPADLLWVWPLAALGFAGAVLARRAIRRW
ncbi:MAG: hypothetical protein ACR2NG_03470 [Acidimicrobiia bacterium]